MVAQKTDKLDRTIKDHHNFSSMEIKKLCSKSPVSRIKNRTAINNMLRRELKQIGDADLIWTVNPLVIRALGKDLLAYGDRHIMQLLELTDDLPLFKGAKHLRLI